MPYSAVSSAEAKVISVTFTWPGVFPVCHRALRRCSPGPVVEFTTLMDRPE